MELITTQGQVLIEIARRPEITQREISQRVGITERAVQRLISELQQRGQIRAARQGRQNVYEVRMGKVLGDNYARRLFQLLHPEECKGLAE